jgi:hypothetical protein
LGVIKKTRKLGVAMLQNVDVDPKKNWNWIGSTGLLGFTILFDVLVTFSLMYLNRKFMPPSGNLSRLNTQSFLSSFDKHH